jgi:hypothetical protein
MITKYEYLPREILKSQELTPAQKLIYLHFFHIAGWQDNTLNITHLSEKLNLDRKTTRNSIIHLEELNLIKVNSDKSVNVYLNGIEIKNKEFFKQEYALKMLGNFVKVPTQFLYDTNLSPAVRLALILVFGFYFTIDEKGNFKNRRNVILQSVATYYGINYDSLTRWLREAKEIGAIDYTVQSSRGKSSIYAFKFFKAETVTVYCNGKTTKKENIEITSTKEEEITEEEPIEEATPEQKAEIEKLEEALKPAFKMQYEESVKDKYEPDYTINWLRKRIKIA